MDQVNKLYYELVSFDPSLAEQKENILKVIEKMISVQPVVEVNPVWKKQFAEKLEEYIASKQIGAQAAKYAVSPWLQKWAYAITTFLIGGVLFAAIYYGMRTKQMMDRQLVNVTRTNMIAQRAKSGLGTGSLFKEMLEARNAEIGTGVVTGTRTVATTTMSTKVDKTGAATKITSPTVASTHNTGVKVAVAETKQTTGNSEAAGTTIMADQTPSDASATRTSVEQQKTVALLFYDPVGKLVETEIIALLQDYDIPATFIEGNIDIKSKLGQQGYETREDYRGLTYIDTKKEGIQKLNSSQETEHIVLFHIDDIIKNPDVLRWFIEKLRNEGYAFANVSAIKK